jgi:hypothetical protein
MKPKLFKITAIVMVLAGVFFSCQSRNEADKPLSDEQISFNLSKNGENAPALLIGEWDCVKFAYTADGNKIRDVAYLSSNSAVIATYIYPGFSYEDEPLGPLLFKNCSYFYSMTGNLINYIQERSPCYAIIEQYTDDEMSVSDALRNTYSFVIKGNELIIHFTGEKNKKLLILKKR